MKGFIEGLGGAHLPGLLCCLSYLAICSCCFLRLLPPAFLDLSTIILVPALVRGSARPGPPLRSQCAFVKEGAS